ncbi:SemiSWEET family transporter [Leuconostoc citreum]
MRNKIHDFVGSIGAMIGLLVFLAYIPQIISNLNGAKGQPWQPLVAAISCFLWVVYGFTAEPKKDYILIIPNVAGVIFGLLTFFTSF